MKTLITKIKIFLSVLFILYGCSDDNNPVNQGNPITDTSYKTYSGTVKMMHFDDSLETDEEIDLSIQNGSSNKGNFFRRSDGKVGLFSINGSSINGTMRDDPSSVFTGVVQAGDNTVSMNLTGTENERQFRVDGNLNREQALDIAGRYFAEETITYTITSQGQSQTQTQSGLGTVDFIQNNNLVSYGIPGSSTVRNGTIDGIFLTFTGIFLIPASPDVILTRNEFTATIVLIGVENDKYHFRFVGTGYAAGTFEGTPFEITGTSNGVIDRIFKVAVAFLHGGAFPLPGSHWDDLDGLGLLRNQIKDIDKRNIITMGFGASILPSQITSAKNWYNRYFVRNLRPRLILVGHSLGGDAVRRETIIPDVFHRITIDPINRDLFPFPFLPSANQRDTIFGASTTAGGFLNILASSTQTISGTQSYNLLGHHISGNGVVELIDSTPSHTNHFTIVGRTIEKNYVKNIVNTALVSTDAGNFYVSSLEKVYSNRPIISDKQPFIVSFGWVQNESVIQFELPRREPSVNKKKRNFLLKERTAVSN